MSRLATWAIPCAALFSSLAGVAVAEGPARPPATLGSHPYDAYERPAACASCHSAFFQQWRLSMMSQAYTHHWDEIEYFELAVPHADQEPKVAAVKAECNGCHAPLAFLAGDTPPPPPAKGSRANESVSCDLCHTISGRAPGDPFNFNWVPDPGSTKYGPRADVESPEHEVAELPLQREAAYCGTCHNEKSPYGVWVKSTQLEWAEGPYSKMGIRCHDCHMPKTMMRPATMAPVERMSHQHLFHGAHVPAKLNGAVELRLVPDRHEVAPGETVRLTLYLFNTKVGHKIPSGSVEERQLWAHVEVRDAKGATRHLPVDRKGFAGEETTIASNAPAWHDIGRVKKIADFKGLPRDGLPEGDRVFRMAYFNPLGEMTIMQWYTAKLGVDYRIGPLETRVETYSFKVPVDAPLGPMTASATINYRLLIPSIGEFLGVPAEETRDQLINTTSVTFDVIDD